MMRILHIGNIANNAYSNAKFLRRAGIEADALSYTYCHVMSCPEWEDAVFDAEVDEYHPDWSRVDLNGFRRPDWFHHVDFNEQHRRHFEGRTRYIRGQFWLEWKAMRCREAFRMGVQYLKLRRTYGEVVTHRNDPLRYGDLSEHAATVRYLEPFMRDYDLIQAYGLYEPKFALLIASKRPFVAFEHGTMRDFPFEDGANGRWISLAYKKARKVIITNPDSILSARKMGLDNVVFIPHPVDETKCRPLTTPLAAHVRNTHGCDYVLFCPSRQNWALKGNDKVIRAFAVMIKHRKLNAVLFLGRWGQEVDRSRALIEELGVGDRVVWLPPLNKNKLVDFYNAADVVLDQFTLGVFGTTTPEAMACGKPVVLHFNEELHKWCFPEMPPVLSAFTESDIVARVMDLLRNDTERTAIGKRARAWVERHHGWELVAQRQIRLYREILEQ